MYRVTSVLALVVACGGDPAPGGPDSGETSATSSSTVDATSSPPQPESCPDDYDAGDSVLPEATVGMPYDVHLGEYVGWSASYMHGVEVPPGLVLEYTSRLHGVPTQAGEFELVIVAPFHWVPPGCPGAESRHTLWLTVVEANGADGSSTSGSSSSGGASGGESSSG